MKEDCALCLEKINTKIFETLLKIEDPNFLISLMRDFSEKRENIISKINVKCRLIRGLSQNDTILLGELRQLCLYYEDVKKSNS